MRVSDVEVTTTADSCELRGQVASDRDPDHDDWFEPFMLWYRFPLWCTPFLRVDNGDPFLSALLVPAMRTGEDLSIPAPVSPRLLDALWDIQAIHRCFEARHEPIQVDALPRHEAATTSGHEPGVGLFFSMGVDSWYCLRKNARDHPADERTISYLIAVHGFDVAYEGWDSTFPPSMLTNFQRIAAECGKTLIPIVTNVRRVTEELAPWSMVHGGATLSIAHALGGVLRRVTLAASTTYDKLYPWGSHPVLDPRWSTEGLAVVHDGCEVDRIDRTRFIAQSPLVRETLRVCPGYGPGYNCGKCYKCLRTMIDLMQAGRLEHCVTFPHEIDPERLRVALRQVRDPASTANAIRRLQIFEESGEAPELRDVLAEFAAHQPGEYVRPRPQTGPVAWWRRRFAR
jgi:hypothetical protein